MLCYSMIRIYYSNIYMDFNFVFFSVIFHKYKRRVPGGKIELGGILVYAKMNLHPNVDVPKGSLDTIAK